MEHAENSLAAQAAELIETEFPLLAGVDDLADRLAVSKCHLIRCFTAVLGTSPGKALTAMRLSAVRAYLESGDYTVETIAGLTGFACGNYLCKVFRKAHGLSPGQYRQRYRGTGQQSAALVRRSQDISFV